MKREGTSLSSHDRRAAADKRSWQERGFVLPALRWPIWTLEAGPLGLFWLVARSLPVETAARLGERLLAFLGPRSSRHRHVLRNLSIALPHHDSEEIERLARGVWGSFGQVVAEYAHLPEVCGSGPGSRIELVKRGDLDIYNGSGRPVILVGAHLANWELLAGAVVADGTPLTVVYTPERNPRVAQMLQRRRRALGCGFVSKLEGLRPLIRELASGRSIGLLIDRRNDKGETLPFFGLDTTLTFSPARLALRYGYQLVPIRIERTGPSRFRVTLYPPVVPDDGEAGDDEKARQMMGKVTALFEEWIQAQPQDWFCTKRMWPKSELARYDSALKQA
jgi:Kdo2-lipid IVA lauroyltransferase/acyltransferase